MYWMVGWLPGGAAGTSFCNGTEMSISFRAIAPAPLLVVSLCLNVEQLRRGAAEDVGLLIFAQRSCREDRINRVQLPNVGIVAAEHDLAGADLRRKVADRFGLEDQRIEIDLLQIFARLLLELDVWIAALRADQAGMVGTIGIGAEIAAAMRGDHLQSRKLVESAFEDQVRQRDRRLERIADGVGKPAVAG